jgi:hypothetical protein
MVERSWRIGAATQKVSGKYTARRLVNDYAVDPPALSIVLKA